MPYLLQNLLLTAASHTPEKAIVAADSLKGHAAHKLELLSTMSAQELIDTAIRSTLNIGIRILIALVVLALGKWLIRTIKHFFERLMIRRGVEDSLRHFLLNLIHISLLLFLAIIIISILGIDTTSFVALFASAGLAVGMALSGTLQNFAGGVMILIFKPFKIGDFIEAQGQTGTVKEIQLFNTVINTTDNKTIMIPNGGISTGIINNYSKESQRRVDWTFGIAYGDNYDLARTTLLALIAADPRIHTTPAPFIALSSLADSSVNLTVRTWVNTEDYWDVYFSMNEQVYKRFAEVGLNIPFPQMDVHLHEGTADKPTPPTH